MLAVGSMPPACALAPWWRQARRYVSLADPPAIIRGRDLHRRRSGSYSAAATSGGDARGVSAARGGKRASQASERARAAPPGPKVQFASREHSASGLAPPRRAQTGRRLRQRGSRARRRVSPLAPARATQHVRGDGRRDGHTRPSGGAPARQTSNTCEPRAPSARKSTQLLPCAARSPQARGAPAGSRAAAPRALVLPLAREQ